MPTPEELAAIAAKEAADKAAAEALKNTPEALKARAEAAEKAAADYKADMLKYKQAAQQTAEEKEKAKADAAKAEEERLKNGNQFKELYEKAQNELKDLSEKNKRQASAFITTLKVSAVQAAATAAGILPQALPDLNMLPLDSVIAASGEDGTITIRDVDAFIAKTKADRPHWFGTGTPPKIVMPGGQGTAGAGSAGPTDKPTPEAMLALSIKDPDAYQAAMRKFFMQ